MIKSSALNKFFLGARKKSDCVGNPIFQPGFSLQVLARSALLKASLKKACPLCFKFRLRAFRFNPWRGDYGVSRAVKPSLTPRASKKRMMFIPGREYLCSRYAGAPTGKKIALFAMYIFFSAALYAAPENAAGAKPEDFAGHINIEARAGQLMYLELPANVYRRAEKRDVSDVRVFDANGVPVPCELRGAPRVKETPPPETVAFFPWTAGEGSLPRGANIEIDSGGAVIKVNPAGRAASKEQSFLLDLSRLRRSPVSLSLETEKSGRQWNSVVTLRYSNDLAAWTRFDKAQTLAGFGEAADTPAAGNTVSLPEGLQGCYVLLTLGETVPPLTAVTAVFAGVSRPETVRESLFLGTKSADGLSVTYSTGGFFPGLELDFILPQPDSLNIEIYCRYSEDAAWRLWDAGELYVLNDADGGTRKNAPWYKDADAPFWQIRSTGGLPFAAVPEMRLVWEPLRVVFLARGEGGWTLAYGNRDYTPAGESLPGAAREQKPLAASVNGEERWQPRPVDNDGGAPWKQILLWSVLVLAAAALSVMAYFMARGMSKKA